MTVSPLDFPDKTLVVIGGGCWGHLHASRLLQARDQGKTAFAKLLVVDRNERHKVRDAFGDRPDVVYAVADWGVFLRDWVGVASRPGDMIVPAPIAPHLFFNWLVGRLQDLPGVTASVAPVTTPLGTPFDQVGHHGERFGSFAEWRCPASCLEPRICPAIRQPRTWEMAAHLESLRPGPDRVETFVARHHAWGVATVPVESLMEAADRLQSLIHRQATSTLWVATVSACHGVVGQVIVSR